MTKENIDLGQKLSEKELCPLDLVHEQEAAFQRDIDRLQASKDRFVEVECPACSKVDTEEIFEKFGFKFKKCMCCETIFMSPRPSEKLLGEYYAKLQLKYRMLHHLSITFHN